MKVAEIDKQFESRTLGSSIVSQLESLKVETQAIDVIEKSDIVSIAAHHSHPVDLKILAIDVLEEICSRRCETRQTSLN
ncbi:MAG: hypothetical protein ACN6O3_19470 [Comamonas sp.]